jgi:uncharacterized Zn-finger protein
VIYVRIHLSKKLIDLRRHIECVHENLKQHQCKICEKRFGLAGNLKRHVLRVHAA